MTDNTIKNTILNGRIELWQPQDGYRASIDPILLAAATHPADHAKVIDLGCGVGTIGLCLYNYNKSLSFTGVEIQENLCDLARKNAPQDNFNFINQSIGNIDLIDFDCAVMNPPYYEEGAHIPSPSSMKAMAHAGRLEMWFEVSARILKKGGTLTGILPAMRFNDMIKYCRKYQFGKMQLYPVFSRFDMPAKRIIFQVRLHKSGETVFHRGLVLHDGNGRKYTDEAQSVLSGENKIDAFVKGMK